MLFFFWLLLSLRFDISLCLIALLIKCVKAYKKDMKARQTCAYAKGH